METGTGLVAATLSPLSSIEEQPALHSGERWESQLAARLRGRTAVVAVLGLGYAGLPMAVQLARAGYAVIGLDVDEERVRLVGEGRSPVSDVSDDEISSLLTSSRLRSSRQFEMLSEVDCALICVPTPLTREKRQDNQFLEAAARSIAEHLHPGMLVVLQSTCSPGTTRNLLLSILADGSGLKVGEQYFVAFAPERIDPGNQHYGVRNTPKLVSGITPRCTDLASLMFSPIVDRLVLVSSPEVAEMAKLVENSFRFINISFMNEIAMLCDRMGISVWEVIDTAATKPFGFMTHYPGPGVGGHCIPVVPFFLETLAQQHGMSADFINVAGRVNEAMPFFVIQKMERLLQERGKQLSEATILLLGVTYKPDLADLRESPALRVLEILLQQGVQVEFLDAHTPVVQANGTTVHSIETDDVLARRFDAAVLLTPHCGVDYVEVGRRAGFVLDTRNHLREAQGLTLIRL